MTRPSAAGARLALPRLGALALALLAVLPACETFRKDEKFTHAIAETFDVPPGLVVEVVDETVAALKLRVLTKSTTHIDGRFEVRSAMGDDYRLLVEGLRTNKTRIEIDMATKRNSPQANLIMTEIASRIRALRQDVPDPVPAVDEKQKSS